MMDERVYQGQQKIWGEMGRIMYYLSLGSLLIKCLALHMGLEACVTEYLVIVGMPVYHMIRSQQLKLSLLPAKRTGKKKTWMIRIGVLAVIGVFWIWNSDRDWKSAAMNLISFLAVFEAIRILVVFAEKKRADRLEREFDDPE